MDPKSGYSAATRTYRNPNPVPPLPEESIPLTITDLAFSLLQSSYPDHSALESVPFLIDGGQHCSSSSSSVVSFGQFIRQVNAFSSFLQISLRRGDVALVLAPTSLRLPVLYFSLLKLGVVVSPANPISTASELAYITQLVKPSVVFTVSELASKAPSHLRTILLDGDGGLSELAYSDDIHSNSIIPPAAVPQSDTAVILFSSGTTGRVKGVEITHRALITSIAGMHATEAIEEGVGASRKSGREVNLFTVPLFHIYGFYFLIWAVAVGETVVLRAGRFDLEEMLRAVERFRVTKLPVSPPIVVAMVKSHLTRTLDLRSLRQVPCGGAPLGADVVHRFKSKFPALHLIQGYGLTEVGGSVSKSIEAVGPDHYGSVGLLTELIQAKIVDPVTGESLPPGRSGELWLKTPSVMKGYVGDPEATKATFSGGGWLKTGDLCYFDSHGFLFVVDRLKELIKYKGYQVPPAELEHLLLSHPDIADAAVVPYPDEEAGQIPIAFVVRKPGSSITATQIMQFVAKQVSPYKKVRRVTFIKDIPKSPSGKILRRELVKQALPTASASL